MTIVDVTMSVTTNAVEATVTEGTKRHTRSGILI